jgi:hypothetical protein
MPRKKSGARGSGGQQPRPAAPKKRPPKRPEHTSPKKGTGAKKRAIEASSSGESDGDDDAPAPAPAGAAASEPTRKCSKCNKPLPKSSFSENQWKKGAKRRCDDCKGSSGGRRKPVASNEEDVTLSATILTRDGEKDSVPVPDDDKKRSARVVHIVRLQRKSGGSRETPEDKVDRGWRKWLGSTSRSGPNCMWSVVDSETGNRLGACAMPISVSVDRTNSRATVKLDSLEATLRKLQMGAISAASLRPEQGVTRRRFLIQGLEDAAELFRQAYLDGSMDVLDRKCHGVARKEDKGLVTHATKGRWPSVTRAKFPRASREFFILEATIPRRGGDGNGWSFVGETVQEAQAQCQRQVSTSAWKCVPSI